MATTHVFIVDTTTFKYHLEYMFAGTGAKDNTIDFNNTTTSELHPKTENNLLCMIADSQRVRVGDYVIFYLQQNFQKKIYEGKFYGVFKVKKEPSFLDNLQYQSFNINLTEDYNFKYPSNDSAFQIKKENNTHTIFIRTMFDKNKVLKKFNNNDDRILVEGIINSYYRNNQFLLEQLGKSLTFRTIIESYQVYAKGVTEWEALDEIKYIHSPHQMLWSLIYRKLKGNRGNTMITIYESERLINLTRNKNSRNVLQGENFTFNEQTKEIETVEQSYSYTGRKEIINVLPRLIQKYSKKKQFESHLQAYLLQNIENLPMFSGQNIEWIGNEVSCGVGMQRIDIMLSIDVENRKVIPIELKSVSVYEGIITQLQRYVDWIEQYYIPNRPSDIEPMIISREIENKNTQSYKNLVSIFKTFNSKNSTLKLRYVEFSIDTKSRIIFDEITY
jgi:predicted RNA-binding protein